MNKSTIALFIALILAVSGVSLSKESENFAEMFLKKLLRADSEFPDGQPDDRENDTDPSYMSGSSGYPETYYLWSRFNGGKHGKFGDSSNPRKTLDYGLAEGSGSKIYIDYPWSAEKSDREEPDEE